MLHVSKKLSDWVLIPLLLVFTGEMIFLLWACGKHLDFTDEAFYVTSSLHPEQFTTRFSDFGYLNAVIMAITGKNLYSLRIAALLILLISSFGFVYQSLLYTEKQVQTRFDKKQRYIWILTGMIASTGYYFWGMTTPSYNFYALVGVLIALTGFLSILNKEKTTVFSVLLLAAGIMILYMGKPTSAVFFVFCTAIWTFFAHYFGLLQIRTIIKPIISSAIVFFILFLSYIFGLYGSLTAYLTHIQHVQQLLSQVGYSPNTMKNSILNSILGEIQKFYFLIPYTLTVIFFVFFLRKKQKIGKFDTNKLYFYFIAFLIAFGGFFSHKGISWKWAWGYMAILYSVIAYVVFYLLQIKQNIKHVILFLLLFLLVSITYIFGTSNIFSTALTGIYVVIAVGLMYLSVNLYQSKQDFNLVFVSISLIVLFSLSTLGQFFINPYRSEVKLYQHTYKLDILGGVYADKPHAEYAKQLIEIQKKYPQINNYEYLVDISGKSAANLILSKKYLGQSWLVWGRTDTYYHFANVILKTVPFDKLNKAILLTNEAVPAEKILKDLPLNFPEQYTCIGKIQSFPEKEYHLLWLPK